MNATANLYITSAKLHIIITIQVIIEHRFNNKFTQDMNIYLPLLFNSKGRYVQEAKLQLVRWDNHFQCL